MAIYGLQNTSSLDIISLIQYDGSGSISIPSGGFQLYSGSYVPGTDYILNTFTASEYNLIDDLDGVLMATFKSLDGGEVIGTLDLSGSLVTTGSINITGSVKVNGQTLATERTKYGALVCETYFEEWTSGWMDSAPSFCAFRLPFPSQNITSDWNASRNRIVLDQNAAVDVITNDSGYVGLQTNFIQKYGSDPQNLGASSNYFAKLFEIINKGLTDTILTLRSVDWPNTYKKFKIKGGTYYTSDYRGLGLPFDFAKLNWGDNISNWGTIDKNLLPKTNIFTNNVDVGRLVEGGLRYQNNIMWPDYTQYFSNNISSINNYYPYFDPNQGNPISQGYFDLDVEEIESDHDWYELSLLETRYIKKTSQEEPTSGFNDEYDNDLFWIDFDTTGAGNKKKEIHIIEESQDWQMPSWANKLTVYAIGAGGGGGGGASGYGHEPTIPFGVSKGIVSSGGVIVDVTPDHVEAIDKSGHEFVTGGGGGAGGNIAISTFDTATVPRGSILNIQVGAGGIGGDGIPYSSDINVTTANEQLFYERYKEVNNPPADIDTQFFKFFGLLLEEWQGSILSESGKIPTTGTRGKMNLLGKSYSGKRGSDTLITLDGNPTPIIKASGGLGGAPGFAIRNYWMTWHRLCGIITHNFALPSVPGGGSSKFDSKGDKVILGGHGGYGISAPNIEKVFEKPPTTPLNFYGLDQVYPRIKDRTRELNSAPNIPWAANANPNLKLPYGHLSYDMDNLGVFDVKSFETPSELAPPGGGGGCGATWALIDNRNLEEIYSENDSNSPNYRWYNGPYWNNELQHWKNSQIPTNYTSVVSSTINNAIKLGSGGKNIGNTKLFEDVDSNGQRFIVNLGEGGNGGYASYGIAKDSELGNTQPNTVQSPGIGSGGGGGAAVYIPNYDDKDVNLGVTGQKGGDGADGLIVLVVESV